jgi:hypothetical protein
VRSALRDVHSGKTQLVGLAPQPQNEIGAGLKGRELHADTALLSIFSTLERLVGSSGGCVVVMRVHETVSPFLIESPFKPNR